MNAWVKTAERLPAFRDCDDWDFERASDPVLTYSEGHWSVATYREYVDPEDGAPRWMQYGPDGYWIEPHPTHWMPMTKPEGEP